LIGKQGQRKRLRRRWPGAEVGGAEVAGKNNGAATEPLHQ